MVNQQTLNEYCNAYLKIADFVDYCPNGLQIEGKENIKKIMAGVSANLALIDCAIDEKVDALFVHHGFFWKGENQTITGIKKNRIKALLDNNINLFAYHLPLDAHPVVGNNMQLAKRLCINNPSPIGDTLVWQGEVDLSLSALSLNIEKSLNRKPWVFGDNNKAIKKITWCSGGAQSYIEHAIKIAADCFISGEVSEQTPAIAKENNIAFICAGHHATERYGVQALCQHLSDKFELDYRFIDIENKV